MKFRRVNPIVADSRVYIDHVCEVAGILVPSEVVLRVMDSDYTSGRMYGRWRMVLSLGKSKQDREHCIAHEVSHAATGHGHDAVFYAHLIDLSRKLGHDMAYLYGRESRYKVRAFTKAARIARLRKPAKLGA